jgi:hypothetical protein
MSDKVSSPQAYFPQKTFADEITVIGPRISDELIEEAIIRTVAYADVFDYPLTIPEIRRYLIGVPASLQKVHAILRNGTTVRRYLRIHGNLVSLAWRNEIIRTRRRRARAAASLWPKASHYGKVIADMPFVRMVAVTGALAMDNVEDGADLDYLVVTRPDRLWTCRALVIALVRWAARRGDILCPNYFLSERALIFSEHSLYTAHELVQMVPLGGWETYREMCWLNGWTQDYLPNATGLSLRAVNLLDSNSHLGQRDNKLRSLAETVLRSPVAGWFERWEMNRKIDRFSHDQLSSAEVSFCADWCKGHFDGHGRQTLKAYTQRLKDLGFA